MTAEPVPAGRTDRAATARLLTEIAFDLFDGQAIAGGAPIRLGCHMEPVGNMTDEQSEFLRTRLGDCRPGLVTTATNRVTWTDSAGISNVAYAGALGAVVPVVAREATLALWARLSAEQRLADRTASLSDTERALLADVTTDKEPLEILRTGIDAAARVLVQHAYLASLTPYDDDLDVVELTPTRFESESAMSTTTFEVPDMTCQHCINTITKAVAELGVEPPEFDLETKRVVAGFASAAIRDDSFAAIRAHGYTVVPLPE